MPASLTYWTHPGNYAGYSPEGHIVVIAKTRDSDALSRTNWDAAIERLSKAWGQPIQGLIEALEIEGGFWNAPDPDKAPAVYYTESSHWACGWVRELFVRPDAPQAVLDEALEIAKDLYNYPALDEDAWSELEYNEACEAWEQMTVKERLDIMRWSDGTYAASIFAARHPYIPNDDQGLILERLAGY